MLEIFEYWEYLEMFDYWECLDMATVVPQAVAKDGPSTKIEPVAKIRDANRATNSLSAQTFATGSKLVIFFEFLRAHMGP